MNQKKKKNAGKKNLREYCMTITFQRIKNIVQDTKKKGCRVICSTKKILSFPEFKIPGNTRNNKDKISKLIKTFLNDLKEAKDKKLQ